MPEPLPPATTEIAEWKDMYGHHSLEAMPYRQHVLRLIAHIEAQQRRIEESESTIAELDDLKASLYTLGVQHDRTIHDQQSEITRLRELLQNALSNAYWPEDYDLPERIAAALSERPQPTEDLRRIDPKQRTEIIEKARRSNPTASLSDEEVERLLHPERPQP